MDVRLSRRRALRALQSGVLVAALPRAALADGPGLAPGAYFADPVEAHARARWVAGLASPYGEPGAEWRAYAQAEDQRWQSGEPRLHAMRAWAARELAPVVPPEHTLFYPFAGPDALHALALFGGARRALLVGLEPVGALPDPNRVASGYFTRLGAALADLHRLTFFRTVEMANDFQREGVLPALVATLARAGGRIIQVTRSGAPIPRARIDWVTDSGKVRRLDYVQLDLANAGLQRAEAFVAELRALSPYVAFVKAAMYLLAEARFSSLRQAILEGSSALLQDDTGVPLRHLDASWATRLFGRYEVPGPPYEARDQRALHEAYEQRRAPALPVGIGYHVQPSRSNLLLATKGRP